MIRDGSMPGQWRYVDRKRNPSDAASRGSSAKALLENNSWRSGPDFLWQDESSWPTPPAHHQCSPMKERVTVNEMLIIAKQEVLRVVQKKAFPKDVKQLTEASLSDNVMTKSVNKLSSICNLDPFMADGLLRVGGRLRHATLKLKQEILLSCRRGPMLCICL